MNVQKLSCHLMDKLSSHLLQSVSPRGSAPPSVSLMGNQAVLQATSWSWLFSEGNLIIWKKCDVMTALIIQVLVTPVRKRQHHAGITSGNREVMMFVFFSTSGTDDLHRLCPGKHIRWMKHAQFTDSGRISGGQRNELKVALCFRYSVVINTGLVWTRLEFLVYLDSDLCCCCRNKESWNIWFYIEQLEPQHGQGGGPCSKL